MLRKPAKVLCKGGSAMEAEVHVGADVENVRVGSFTSTYQTAMPILFGIVGAGGALLFFTNEKTGPSIPAIAIGLVGGVVAGYFVSRDTLSA